jgi:DNA-binding response OmpR family regulator
MTRIALADDDVEVRQLLAELFREQGMEVLEATDGATLLGMLQRTDVTLVVTDLWMPHLTGSDVLELRRKSGDRTPFLVITAAPLAVAEPVLQTEGVTLLRKPFTEQDVVAAVQAALDAHRGAAALANGTPPEGVATTVLADAAAVAQAAGSKKPAADD